MDDTGYPAVIHDLYARIMLYFATSYI